MRFIVCIFVNIRLIAMFDGGIEVWNRPAIVNSCFRFVEVGTIVCDNSIFSLLGQLVSSFCLLIERYHRLGDLLGESLSLLGCLLLKLGQTSLLA